MKKSIAILSLTLLALVGLNYLQAATWTEPANGTVAPNGNTDAPINVGSTDQVKSGGIGVSTLSTDQGLGMMVYNTSDNGNATGWYMKRNDGTGNFLQYWNTTGGRTPTYETNGFAFRNVYNLGAGIYQFQSGGANAGTTGSTVTWNDVLNLYPDGRVGMDQLCTANGGNCINVSSLSSGIALGDSLPTSPVCTVAGSNVRPVFAGLGIHNSVLSYKYEITVPHASNGCYGSTDGYAIRYYDGSSWSACQTQDPYTDYGCKGP